MGVVLGIAMILCILFKSLLLSHSHPTSPMETSILKLVVRVLLLCVIRYSMVYTHTSWSPRKSPPFKMSCRPYFVRNMAPMALSLGNLAPCYETCKNLSIFHESVCIMTTHNQNKLLNFHLLRELEL